jgi:hypothetical protein
VKFYCIFKAKDQQTLLKKSYKIYIIYTSIVTLVINLQYHSIDFKILIIIIFKIFCHFFIINSSKLLRFFAFSSLLYFLQYNINF